MRIVSILAALGALAAQADTLLLNFNYRLRANQDYTTGLYRVYGAPAAATRIAIRQTGSSYCDIRVRRVEYNTVTNGPLRDARSVAGTTSAHYEIPEGVVNAVEVHFYQHYWDGVDCGVNIYAVDGGGGPIGQEQLLGAIRYTGGFVAKASLPTSRTLYGVTQLRLAIPAFCQNVSVLEAGTVSAGVFYAAQALGGNAFKVGPLGGQGVTAIQASLNGPVGATCDIPVYGQVTLANALRD